MKRKYLWAPEDIKAGRYIIRESSPQNNDNIRFACSVAYKIGFTFSPDPGKPNTFALVSITDGLISSIGSKQEMADELNNDKFGFRPLKQKDLLQCIAHLKSQNTGKS